MGSRFATLNRVREREDDEGVAAAESSSERIYKKEDLEANGKAFRVKELSKENLSMGASLGHTLKTELEDKVGPAVLSKGVCWRVSHVKLFER